MRERAIGTSSPSFLLRLRNNFVMLVHTLQSQQQMKIRNTITSTKNTSLIDTKNRLMFLEPTSTLTYNARELCYINGMLHRSRGFQNQCLLIN
ncbi:hypothetical protein JTE90_026328 [Oedothorax gibbosus]|uniref:Uncharacterized protein n=1 Tax=Oedothorax gibbosus TaxID=931172 RepID=A0AAV6U5J0_9ARAC|nr:hypothetical protein JTE90_026328 [Oedothorax gibbosus]